MLLSDRIDTARLERGDLLATNPLAFPVGKDGGIAVVFRYGVVVFIGASTAEQESVLDAVRQQSSGTIKRREEETAVIELSPDKDEQIPPGGPICLKALTPERVLLIAEALAKSVVLARDENEVAGVFDVIEPFARHLASTGRTPGGRRAMLKHIGNALLVQHRVSGRVAVAEKPNVLWDRPDLERLYGETRGRIRAQGTRRRADPQARSDLRDRAGADRHHRHGALAAAGADDRRVDPVGNHFHDP